MGGPISMVSKTCKLFVACLSNLWLGEMLLGRPEKKFPPKQKNGGNEWAGPPSYGDSNGNGKGNRYGNGYGNSDGNGDGDSNGDGDGDGDDDGDSNGDGVGNGDCDGDR